MTEVKNEPPHLESQGVMHACSFVVLNDHMDNTGAHGVVSLYLLTGWAIASLLHLSLTGQVK